MSAPAFGQAPPFPRRAVASAGERGLNREAPAATARRDDRADFPRQDARLRRARCRRLEPTEPRFADEAATLAAAAAKLGPKKLGGLMHISPKLAKLNAERFSGFRRCGAAAGALSPSTATSISGWRRARWSPRRSRFAQDHLRILSGLYGLLRPLDAIRPYRLEMGTPLGAGAQEDLYAWWARRLSDALAADLAAEGSAHGGEPRQPGILARDRRGAARRRARS